MIVYKQKFIRYVKRVDVYVLYDTKKMRKYIVNGESYQIIDSIINSENCSKKIDLDKINPKTKLYLMNLIENRILGTIEE